MCQSRNFLGASIVIDCYVAQHDSPPIQIDQKSLTIPAMLGIIDDLVRFDVSYSYAAEAFVASAFCRRRWMIQRQQQMTTTQLKLVFLSPNQHAVMTPSNFDSAIASRVEDIVFS